MRPAWCWSVLALLAALLPGVAAGAAADLMEDVDYRVIPERKLTDTERIEVVYFFYYGCQWCFRFEPYISGWLKNKPVDVSFRRIPALRSSRWITLTRAFYALDALGLIPQLHDRVFRAFHQDDVNLQSEGTLFDWVAKQGVDRDRFEQAYRSDAVTTQMDASRQLTDLFEVDTTPSVVVDGRYLTSSGMTGGVAELLLVMEDLIDKVRAERRALK